MSDRDQADAPEVEQLARDLARRLSAGRQFLTGAGFTDAAGVEYLVGISERTLRAWRAAGSGPRFVRAARTLYPLDGLAAWLKRPAGSGDGEEASDIDTADQARHASSRTPRTARTR